MVMNQAAALLVYLMLEGRKVRAPQGMIPGNSRVLESFLGFKDRQRHRK